MHAQTDKNGDLIKAISIALISGLLILPLAITDVPPVLDYPNHLGGAFVLAFGAHDSALSRMYAAHWRVIPNLAVDIILPALMAFLPMGLAGKLVLGATIWLPLLGTLAYSRAKFHQWSLWPWATALVAYNLAFMLGFMSFLFGVAAALGTAALWIIWRETNPIRGFFCGVFGALIVFFCHIIALALLGALILGHECEFGLGGLYHKSKRLFLALSIFIAPLLLLWRGPLGSAQGPTDWAPVPSKLLMLLSPLMNYSLPLDLLTMSVVVSGFTIAIRHRTMAVPKSTAAAFALLLGFYVIAPIRFHGGYYFDTRFPIMLGFLAFAGTMYQPVSLSSKRSVLVGFALTFLVRSVLVLFAWHNQSLVSSQVRDTIAPVTAGSRVLVAWVTPSDAPDYWAHLPLGHRIDDLIATDRQLGALVLTDHRAFWPLLFTDPAQQPIAVLPPFLALSAPSSEPPSYRKLAVGLVTQDDRHWFPFLDDWPSHFDFVLVLDAGGMIDAQGFLPKQLQLLRLSDAAALYKITTPDVLAPQQP